jgi:hypothetical protein
MQLKYNIEEGFIVLFSVVIDGYSSIQIVKDLLDKIWMSNRWNSRFYCSVKDRCRKHVVEVRSLNKKDELSRAEFIRQISMRTPKTKKITIS